MAAPGVFRQREEPRSQQAARGWVQAVGRNLHAVKSMPFFTLKTHPRAGLLQQRAWTHTAPRAGCEGDLVGAAGRLQSYLDLDSQAPVWATPRILGDTPKTLPSLRRFAQSLQRLALWNQPEIVAILRTPRPVRTRLHSPISHLRSFAQLFFLFSLKIVAPAPRKV